MSDQGPYAPPGAPVQGGGNTAGGGVTQRMVDLVRGTKPWVIVMAVLASLGTIMMFGFGVLMLFAGAFVPAEEGAPPMAALSAIYFFGGIFYLWPTIKLWKMVMAMSKLKSAPGVSRLEDVLDSHRSFWKGLVILMIVGIVLYVLAIVAMFVFIGAEAFPTS